MNKGPQQKLWIELVAGNDIIKNHIVPNQKISFANTASDIIGHTSS
jgi:hypothetical protein